MSDTEPTTPEQVVVPGEAEPAEGTVGSSVPEQPEKEEDEDLEDADNTELEEVARQVIAGEWGTGQEQRQKLSEAGYDHREVDKVVTRLRNNL